jgi:hypothetical protein
LVIALVEHAMVTDPWLNSAIFTVAASVLLLGYEGEVK